MPKLIVGSLIISTNKKLVFAPSVLGRLNFARSSLHFNAPQKKHYIMFNKLNIHIKGALFFLGSAISFGIAFMLYWLDVSQVYWISSIYHFGAVTFIGLAGTLGGGFLLAFYFGYVATLIEGYKIKEFVKTVRSDNE